MTQTHYDAIIIGSGAAGLSAAQALGRSLRRTLVIDAGAPRNRFATHMHNVLGHDGTPPLELVAKGRAEAERYGVEFRSTAVTGVRDIAGGLAVTVEDPERAATATELTTRALIVATGARDVLPDVPGLAECWGSTVLHCPYCHGWEVRGERLGVLALSPASLHQARLIRQWSERVTVFGAALGELDPHTLREFQARNIELVVDPVAAVEGEAGRVTGVRTENGDRYEIDALFTGAPVVPRDEFLASLELDRVETPQGSVLAVNPAGQTSHPRIWAVGNVVAPTATVPIVMGAGAMAGGMVNFALIEEDFANAVAGADRAGA